MNQKQKRLNRKKILDILYSCRQGFADVMMSSAIKNDRVLYVTAKSYHKELNNVIQELGGEIATEIYNLDSMVTNNPVFQNTKNLPSSD